MTEVLSNPRNPCPPEILAQIGQITVQYVDFDGATKHGIIELHTSLAADVRDFFALALELNFPIHMVTPASAPEYEFDDDALMSANVSSGFNYRTIAGTDTPSLHGLGRAIDINPRLNPYTTYQSGKIAKRLPENGSYDPSRPGTFTTDHPLVTFMRSRGWHWGGDWTIESGRIDLHHFQKPE